MAFSQLHAEPPKLQKEFANVWVNWEIGAGHAGRRGKGWIFQGKADCTVQQPLNHCWATCYCQIKDKKFALFCRQDFISNSLILKLFRINSVDRVWNTPGKLPTSWSRGSLALMITVYGYKHFKRIQPATCTGGQKSDLLLPCWNCFYFTTPSSLILPQYNNCDWPEARPHLFYVPFF